MWPVICRTSADGKVLCYEAVNTNTLHHLKHTLNQEHSAPGSAHVISVSGCVVCLCFTEDLLTAKAIPPSEKEFLDAFQKFRYCFSLLVSRRS